MELPTLADRAWYALHCLPRNERGEPPDLKMLEKRVGLPNATLSRIMNGTRLGHRHDTFEKVARALQVTEAWLHGLRTFEYGPTLTGFLPPRRGMKWIRYGDVPGWRESVALALLEPNQMVPPQAFLAGAELPVVRPIDKITPIIAIFVAGFAYETSTREEQDKWTTQEARFSSTGLGSTRMRAAPLRRPAVK